MNMKFSDTEYGDLTGQIYKGDIDVSNMNLNSLKGAPKEVLGNFWCSNNKLTSLKGAPKVVNGSFDCSDNKLTSLEDAPKKVKYDFYCNNNLLTQSEVDKIVSINIDDVVKVSGGLKTPTPKDYKLYKKLCGKKYFKLKN